MTSKSQPLVRQMGTEVVAEVVLKDQNQDVDLCMVGVHEPGLVWSLVWRRSLRFFCPPSDDASVQAEEHPGPDDATRVCRLW